MSGQIYLGDTVEFPSGLRAVVTALEIPGRRPHDPKRLEVCDEDGILMPAEYSQVHRAVATPLPTSGERPDA